MPPRAEYDEEVGRGCAWGFGSMTAMRKREDIEKAELGKGCVRWEFLLNHWGPYECAGEEYK